MAQQTIGIGLSANDGLGDPARVAFEKVNENFTQVYLESIIAAVTDDTSAISSGTGKVTFRSPYAFILEEVRASLTTAQSSGSIFTVDINVSGVSALGTKITIDNGEKTSFTAISPPNISNSSINNDAEISVDVDQVGDGTARGLKIMLLGRKA